MGHEKVEVDLLVVRRGLRPHQRHQSMSFLAMVTVWELASQVEGMEARMVTLQSEFKQELDGFHSTVLQLNPGELMAGMTKISHLEQSVNALDEGIQEIKKLLLTGRKESAYSSTPGVDLNP